MQFGFAYTAVKNGNGLGADFNLDLKQDETVQKRISKKKRNIVSLFFIGNYHILYVIKYVIYSTYILVIYNLFRAAIY